MKGDPIPDADHIARYCSPKRVRKENGLPMVSAFECAPNGSELSVNWLEFFPATDSAARVDAMRRSVSNALSLNKNGRFAVLNVGLARQSVLDATHHQLRIEHSPTSTNPSHSEISGYPADDVAVAHALQELVTLANVYPVTS